MCRRAGHRTNPARLHASTTPAPLPCCTQAGRDPPFWRTPRGWLDCGIVAAACLAPWSKVPWATAVLNSLRPLRLFTRVEQMEVRTAPQRGCGVGQALSGQLCTLASLAELLHGRSPPCSASALPWPVDAGRVVRPGGQRGWRRPCAAGCDGVHSSVGGVWTSAVYGRAARLHRRQVLLSPPRRSDLQGGWGGRGPEQAAWARRPLPAGCMPLRASVACPVPAPPHLPPRRLHPAVRSRCKRSQSVWAGALPRLTSLAAFRASGLPGPSTLTSE